MKIRFSRWVLNKFHCFAKVHRYFSCHSSSPSLISGPVVDTLWILKTGSVQTNIICTSWLFRVIFATSWLHLMCFFVFLNFFVFGNKGECEEPESMESADPNAG